MRIHPLFFALACAALLSACGGGDQPDKSGPSPAANATAGPARPVSRAAEAPPPIDAAHAKVDAGGNPLVPPQPKLGVASCDDYIEQVRTCLNTKVTNPFERNMLASGIEQSMNSLRTQIQGADPQAAAQYCAQWRADQAQTLTRVGCTGL